MDPGQKDLTRDIVVIGGSAGALEALGFIADLSADFPAAIFLVMHLAAEGPGMLPDILGRSSKIAVQHGHDGDRIAPGRIYVAPPDHHMTIKDGTVKVARGPKENRHRPSIDVLFRSAAEIYGPRVIGVVLSGMLDDGSSGLVTIRARGGLAIVQEPKDALFPDMPSNAIAYAGADYRAPHSQLAALLMKSVTEKIDERILTEARVERGKEQGSEVSEVSMDRNSTSDKSGEAAEFSCPDCGGVLRRIENGKILRFKCRVGHTYSGQTLLEAQSETIEQALWSALRLMEEKAEMVRKLKEYALARNFKVTPKKFEDQAKKLEADARAIRELLKSTQGGEAE
jgi:two-component system chemotaxis response regulator CheB